MADKKRGGERTNDTNPTKRDGGRGLPAGAGVQGGKGRGYPQEGVPNDAAPVTDPFAGLGDRATVYDDPEHAVDPSTGRDAAAPESNDDNKVGGSGGE